MSSDMVGISSACFYPLETELSLIKAADCGAKVTELFLNTLSELEPEYVNELLKIKNERGLDIVSLHPFGSFTESFALFSSYNRRFTDYIPLYRQFFSVAEKLGCKLFVVHGAKIPGSVDDDTYCERFSKMIDIAAEYGIIYAHENVVHYRSESPDYLLMMREKIGDKFKIVLDIKQARRAGFSPYDFVDKLKDDIIHIHISDYNNEKDCIPPGLGEFDFNKFFKTMFDAGYNGKYIIELYNNSYKNENEISNAFQFVKENLKNVYTEG